MIIQKRLTGRGMMKGSLSVIEPSVEIADMHAHPIPYPPGITTARGQLFLTLRGFDSPFVLYDKAGDGVQTKWWEVITYRRD